MNSHSQAKHSAARLVFVFVLLIIGIISPGLSAMGAGAAPKGQARGFFVSDARQVPGAFELAIYNTTRDRLYASVSASGTGGTISEINPSSGVIERSLPTLGRVINWAITDDGKYLYYTYQSNSVYSTHIERIDLDLGQTDLSFSGVIPASNDDEVVTVILTIPEQPGSILVRQWNRWGTEPDRWIAFDEGVARSYHPGDTEGITSLAFTEDGSLIGQGLNGFYRGELQSDGVHFVNTGSVLTPSRFDRYSQGLLFYPEGYVFDLAAQTFALRYPVGYGASYPKIDPLHEWVYFVGSTGTIDFYPWEGGPKLGSIPLKGPPGMTIPIEAGASRVAVLSGSDMGSGNALWLYAFTAQRPVAYLPLMIQQDATRVVAEYPIVGRCQSSFYPSGGSAQARVEFCITAVQERVDEKLVFIARWTVTFLSDSLPYLIKYADQGNRSMYVVDSFGNRYDHVSVTGSAAVTTYLTRSEPVATGGFVFPPPAAGATVFRFVDEDQGLEIRDIPVSP